MAKFCENEMNPVWKKKEQSDHWRVTAMKIRIEILSIKY